MHMSSAAFRKVWPGLVWPDLIVFCTEHTVNCFVLFRFVSLSPEQSSPASLCDRSLAPTRESSIVLHCTSRDDEGQTRQCDLQESYHTHEGGQGGMGFAAIVSHLLSCSTSPPRRDPVAQ